MKIINTPLLTIRTLESKILLLIPKLYAKTRLKLGITYPFNVQCNQIIVPMSRRAFRLSSRQAKVETLLFNLSTPLKVTKTNFRNESGHTN